MFVELDRNTIDGLLQAIDEAIVRYDESAEIIEKEYSALSSPRQKAKENYCARKEQNEQFCDKNIQSFVRFDSYRSACSAVSRRKKHQYETQFSEESRIWKI